jgi:hypothetical protein
MARIVGLGRRLGLVDGAEIFPKGAKLIPVYDAAITNTILAGKPEIRRINSIPDSSSQRIEI